MLTDTVTSPMLTVDKLHNNLPIMLCFSPYSAPPLGQVRLWSGSGQRQGRGTVKALMGHIEEALAPHIYNRIV